MAEAGASFITSKRVEAGASVRGARVARGRGGRLSGRAGTRRSEALRRYQQLHQGSPRTHAPSTSHQAQVSEGAMMPAANERDIMINSSLLLQSTIQWSLHAPWRPSRTKVVRGPPIHPRRGRVRHLLRRHERGVVSGSKSLMGGSVEMQAHLL